MKERALAGDSGANCCISNDRSDFNIYHAGGPKQVDGIGKGLKIVGHGEVKWTIKGDNGRFRTLYLTAYYVPTVTTRIASLQVILETHPAETIMMNHRELMLS